LLGQAVDPELVTHMRANDGQAQAPRQFGRAAGMVYVCMRQPDLHQLQAQALDFGQDVVQITAGVDHGRLHRLVAPDQGTILLERGNWEGGVVKHGGVGGFRLQTVCKP
jgi:hypothetical protein